MTLKRIAGWSRIVQVLCLVVGSAACTNTYNFPLESISTHPKQEKINLNVELILSEELRNAQFNGRVVFDTVVIPLGEAFTQNAEKVTRELFAGVVVSNRENGSAPTGVDAVLIPKMQLAAATLRQGRKGEQVITVMFEWRLKDLDGATIWVKTIRGDGTSEGHFFQRKVEEKRVRGLNQDLFQKSFEAISSSPEIRNFEIQRLAKK